MLCLFSLLFTIFLSFQSTFNLFLSLFNKSRSIFFLLPLNLEKSKQPIFPFLINCIIVHFSWTKNTKVETFFSAMKQNQINPEKFMWDSVKNQSNASISQNRTFSRLMVWLILFISATYVIYTLKLLSSSNTNHTCEKGEVFAFSKLLNQTVESRTDESHEISIKTGLEHVVFGIGASAKLWEKRKEYIKLWWKPQMRGIVWLDKPVKTRKNEKGKLPLLKVSGDTSHFKYKNKQGHHSAIRISRIVSETLRLGDNENVRWFVMGDDDTVFVTDNLLRVLNKYDHNQHYYIGSLSESHLQNIYFSYGMAYGGGGFAISYALAKVLERMQDKCIQRYPGLYGSDDRMQACMAELGVPLTKELGFHQYDVYGNLFGLLASHPITPLVSLHHLDVVEPIFPNVTQVQALERLKLPMRLDSAGLMQQSICYDKANGWSVSVSWGFAVQIIRGIMSPRELEMPSRTFLNWYRRADYTAYAFNTRPVARNPCQKPFVFYLSKVETESDTNRTVSEYTRHVVPHPACRWKLRDPSEVERIVVYKKPDPQLWDRSPRRNCCRVLSSVKKQMVIDVGVCRENEISEVQI